MNTSAKGATAMLRVQKADLELLKKQAMPWEPLWHVFQRMVRR